MLRMLSCFALLALLMGHDHGGCGAGDGAPTEADCDPRLRYESFGKDFMATYCTGCHATTVHGGERRGAPVDHNFDTQAGIQLDLEHIELTSAAGPGATNDYMPPYGATPTAFEREQLGRWLACGAP